MSNETVLSREKFFELLNDAQSPDGLSKSAKKAALAHDDALREQIEAYRGGEIRLGHEIEQKERELEIADEALQVAGIMLHESQAEVADLREQSQETYSLLLKEIAGHIETHTELERIQVELQAVEAQRDSAMKSFGAAMEDYEQAQQRVVELESVLEKIRDSGANDETTMIHGPRDIARHARATHRLTAPRSSNGGEVTQDAETKESG